MRLICILFFCRHLYVLSLSVALNAHCCTNISVRLFTSSRPLFSRCRLYSNGPCWPRDGPKKLTLWQAAVRRMSISWQLGLAVLVQKILCARDGIIDLSVPVYNVDEQAHADSCSIYSNAVRGADRRRAFCCAAWIERVCGRLGDTVWG